MSTKADVPGLRISSYMNLEQAMAEVRAYLEAKKKHTGMQLDTAGVGAGQLSLQNAFADRLADISRRLGEIEPNSKLGPADLFLKRILRKLIGWYSKPAQEFIGQRLKLSGRSVRTCFSCNTRLSSSIKNIHCLGYERRSARASALDAGSVQGYARCPSCQGSTAA